MRLLVLFALLLAFMPAWSAERDYQGPWCAAHQGVTEYVLPDKTRVDCLTETHAIEFDFAKKWAESLGQALWYAFQTNKRAGIVLILRSEKDRTYWYRLNSTIIHFKLPVDVWTIEAY